MKKKYFKNLITAFLITSFMVTPLGAIPREANARSIGAYTSGLIPAITQLPLCKGKITRALSPLFGQSSADAAFAAQMKQVSAGINTALGKLSLNEQLSDLGVGKIETFDETTSKKIDELKEQLKEIRSSTESLDSNDTCLKNIGRLVIKMLLQKITVSTVAWINSGFDGKPAFVQDPEKFFRDIAKNEILQFGGELNNPELFPFGKEWFRSTVTSFNNKFTDNARYSLDELIQNTTPQYSSQSFQLDFSQGGWGAWSAMTQNQANNPLGFQLLASDELQRRLEGTSQSVAENTRKALDQASGFLGDQRCLEPKNLSRQEDTAGRLERSTKSTGPYTKQICTGGWQYVTPGKVIAEAATNVINYPNNNLLKADDLNDAVAAIADALLSRWSSDLMEKGLAALDDKGADGTFIYNPDSARANYGSQTQSDFSPVHLTSSWLQANPDFNIRTDLTTALIDEQRTYSNKLALQNKELNSTTDGKDYKIETSGLSNAYGLIPAIGQLDYCIPGPHPGWEEDSRNVLDAVTNVIIPETEESVKNKDEDMLISTVRAIAPLAAAATGAAIGASIGSVVPIVGTLIGLAVGAIVGGIVGFVVGLFGDDNGRKVRGYYAGIIRTFTGVHTDYPIDNNSNSPSNNLSSKQGAVQTLNIILERYIDIMHMVYNPKLLPSVAKEATTAFSKLEGYGQMMRNNEEAMSSTKNVVNTLGGIKNTIETLNQRREDGDITDAQYEDELKPQINAFGRISANMVNGDDIASADNLLKQIIDEKNYVYNDLLKGPLGCEKDLEDNKQNLPRQLTETKRMNYPFPIFYNYDMPAGANIPDPWQSGYNNKTYIFASHTYGPGFLSYYSFQIARDGNTFAIPYIPCVRDANGVVAQCMLRTVDILPLWDSRGQAGVPDSQVKRSLGATKDNTTSPWEYIIGVY